MTNVLFSAFPYAALLLLGAGLLVRYALTARRMEAVTAEATEAWEVFGGGKVWRASFVVLGLAHVGGMALPQTIRLWNGAPLRLLLLESTGFLVGALAVLGCLGVMRRHLRHSSASVASEVADCLLVSLMLVGLLSGLLTAIFYRWGSSWGAVTLAPYLASLVHGAPLPALVERMPRMVQLHVLSAFAIMIVFPFTRASSFAMLGVHQAIGFAVAPISAASKAAEGWIQRNNPIAWIWVEDEDVVPASASMAVGSSLEQRATPRSEPAIAQGKIAAIDMNQRPSGVHAISRLKIDSARPAAGGQGARSVTMADSAPPVSGVRGEPAASRRSNDVSRKVRAAKRKNGSKTG